MSRSQRLVIVGASYAGVQLAASARELGFQGSITLLGEETREPYQRPPLSKAVLKESVRLDQLALKGEAFWREESIDLRLGQRVTQLDIPAHQVVLQDGTRLPYDWLALTTGARNRRLSVPGADLAGVHDVRSADDAQRLLAALPGCRRVCVIGGGFIGLEVASALQARGLTVTLLETRPRLLERVFPHVMSDYVARVHRAHGIHLRLACGVRQLHGETRVRAVELEDGTHIDCDLVVTGIGVEPEVTLARAAGLEIDNGICVDACGRTSVPQVLAAGDVANALLPPWGPAVHGFQRLRLESVQAANELARACASVIVGQPRPFTAVPWFWSDQFDLKFQMAGLAQPQDQMALRGDMAMNKFSCFYLRDGVVVAAHSVNRPAEHMMARKLIASGARASAAQIMDETYDLKNALLAVPSP